MADKKELSNMRETARNRLKTFGL